MLLAVDTSTMQFSLAVMNLDGSVRAEYAAGGGKGRFIHLMPVLHSLLETAQVELGHILYLAAALGPGSFTGLRVGLSLAKGLAHALDLPLIGVPSLMAMAVQAAPAEVPVAPLLDSRRNEFFTALFKAGSDGRLVRLTPDTTLKPEQFPLFFRKPILLIGNDYHRQAPLFKHTPETEAVLAPPWRWGIRASGVGTLALERFHDGDWDDPRLLSPLYLRPPDIRPPAGGIRANGGRPPAPPEGH